ncbi:MAG TPA: molybdopterin-binding protein [Myxococcota bacterium]|nr:molybdopterin-binding protein [Myxococcota bacterium]HQK50261.1 molybdopterin-binding protein [Myxococcota bacterium]
MEPGPTAAVLIIGNEVLSGRTQDQNLAFLARRLGEMGVPVIEARVVRDREEEIVQAVRQLRDRCTWLFTTGGIGPTHDDITTGAVARAFGVPVVRHPEAEARLRAHYAPGEVTEARLKMADVPEGASLIDNPVSTAPGYRIGNVFVLAGVPVIAQAMFESLAPALQGGPPIRSRTVRCRTPEGVMAGPLGEVQRRHPEVEIGSYPFFRRGEVGVSLVVRGTDPEALEVVVRELVEMLRGLGDDPET